MKVNVSKTGLLVLGVFVLGVLVAGFGMAIWNADNTMFHSAEDVKVLYNGEYYNLQEVIPFLGGGGGLPVCLNNQVLIYDSGAWVCSDALDDKQVKIDSTSCPNGISKINADGSVVCSSVTTVATCIYNDKVYTTGATCAISYSCSGGCTGMMQTCQNSGRWISSTTFTNSPPVYCGS